ncbi:MAG: hypothetical protein WC979_08205 [Candidatus Pacearchaeota archaeon]|jgi:hypothetical protein
MSLRLEIYVEGNWRKVGELLPGDRPGSISDNNPEEGKRDVYLFQCEPLNRRSVIYRSKGGLDFDVEHLRVTDTAGLEEIKELTHAQPTYELTVKTDQSTTKRRIRFTHTIM